MQNIDKIIKCLKKRKEGIEEYLKIESKSKLSEYLKANATGRLAEINNLLDMLNQTK
ncbi:MULTISPECIES: hypothetical protein [Clostridium]|uniref:hypothetical protein n=1 Tax=Clostridium TaxID=1485 RepID=UPI00242A503A|nr:hypothetical protein [Clostridium tyrobutyricum]